jgi:hypothetical protein
MRIIRLSSLPATIGTRMAVACSAAALAVGFAVGAGLVYTSTKPEQAPAVARTTAAPPLPPITTAVSRGPHDRPDANDFIMEGTITSKKCYGAAGCDYVYRPYPMFTGKQQLPLPAAYTVTYGVQLCDELCRHTAPPARPDFFPQVGSFKISPDGFMTYDHEGTINGPDGRTVELYALAVLEDHGVGSAR